MSRTPIRSAAVFALAALAVALAAAPLPAAAQPEGTTVIVGEPGRDLGAERAAAGLRPRGAMVLAPSAGPWLVPFVVDPGNLSGTTTLLSVRNDAPVGDANVLVEFLDDSLAEFHEVALVLEPDQLQSFNLRDQPNLPPQIGLTTGLVRVTAEPGQLISVDTFRVVPGDDFATGGLAIDLSVEECASWRGRILVGGPFTGGTTLSFFINGPQGADTVNDPPTITGTPYRESGEALPPFSVWTAAWTLDLDAGLLFAGDQLFGTVELVIDGTQGGGHLTVRHSAEGRYSLTVPGVCLEPPV
jgi:hypothetical protein